MKAILNKNVVHNGKAYDKGSKISAGDDGYEALVNAGHANLVAQEKEEQGEEQMPEGSESEEQSEPSGKSGKKSKR